MSQQDVDISSTDETGVKHTLQVNEVAVIAVAGGLILAFLPLTLVPSYTPRLALLVVLLPLGVQLLIQGVHSRRPAAMLAASLSLWCVISGLLSGEASTSLLGVLGRESSGLIVIGTIAGWAAANAISSRGASILEAVLLAALALNATIGIGQVALGVDSGALQLYDGRATGLLVSHVAFGACMAGGAAMLAAQPMRTPTWPSYSGIALLAAAANLSGSRFPVVAGLVAILVVRAVGEGRRRVLAAIAYASGVGASIVLSSAFGLSVSATERAVGSGGAGRVAVWRMGLAAALERPVFGWGPGRFRAAVQGRFGADFTAQHAQDELTQIWWDAHNIAVNTATTLGIVGLLIALAFAVAVARLARGPLAVFSAVVASTWLLQPAGLATLPVVLICLGAAAQPASVRGVALMLPDQPAPPIRWSRPLVLTGVILALIVLTVDLRIERALSSQAPEAVALSIRWLPWDPAAADVASRAYRVAGGHDHLEQSIEWAQRAVDREPDRPLYLNRLAELYLLKDDSLAARESLERARLLQHWNVSTLNLLWIVAERTQDLDLEAELSDALCELGRDWCAP